MPENTDKMKSLACQDVGIDCDFIARGKMDKEVIDMTMSHIREIHPDKWDEMMMDMNEKEIRDIMTGMIK